MPLKYELMAAIGQYQKDGETKTRWLKVGAVFTGDRNPSVKIEAIPTVSCDRDGNTVAWDGRLQCFEPRQRQAPQQAPQQDAPQATGADYDDDLPF